MNRSRSSRLPLAILSVLFVGAISRTSFGAVMSVEAASSPSYTVYKDSSGYTCAKNTATSAIDYRSTTSAWVIQKAIDKYNGGSVYIKSGTYDISNNIYTSTVSIYGDGNSTILKATSGLGGQALIRVTDDYYKLDGSKATYSRPNGVTISYVQIDGNRGSRTSGTIEGIGFVNAQNSHIIHVYVHDICAGQGLYMSNSQYCTIEDCQIYNVGGTSYSQYGSGIAFGEASRTKVASSYITIDNVRISKSTMSMIDLEPANHVTISNCVFTDASTWNGHATPVITAYAVYGYAANDYITITNNDVTGAFGEFFIMTPSNYDVVSYNDITYTAGYACAIYSSKAHDNQIIGNTIKVVSKDAIVSVDCNSYTISGNTITDTTSSKSDYGVRFYASSGTSTYNGIKSNQITGFNNAIVANSRSDHTTVTYNTVKTCYIGILLSGSSNTKTGNTLNGAYDWTSS